MTNEAPGIPIAVEALAWFERPFVAPLSVVFAAILSFHGVLNNGFVFFDDDKAILYNAALQAPSLATFFSGQNLGMYAPLTWMAYWLGTSISGQEAWGHHLIALVLHALSALLVWRFLRQMTGQAYTALFAALIFAAHPIQTEAVAWAAAMSTVLFAFFYLVALNGFVAYRTKDSARGIWYGLSLLFFALSCLSKSAAVTLPLVLIALDWCCFNRPWRQMWVDKLPFLAISLGFGLYTFSTRAQEGHDIATSSAVFSALDRLWMVTHTIWFYPVKMLWPFGYSIAYPFVKTSGTWPLAYYLALPALMLAGGLIWYFRRHDRLVLMGLALYLLPLSVMLPFQTVGTFELRSDRYAYLSIIGVALLLAEVVRRLKDPIKTGILVGVSALLMLLSVQQTAVWKDGIRLFEHCVDKTPDAALCQCNLAYNELITLQFDRAITHYSNTLRLDSTYIEAYNGRGQAYLMLQKFPAALSDFNNAIRYGLSSPKLFMNRGKCLYFTDQFAEAVPAFNRSLELEPNAPESWFYLGMSHLKSGNVEQAKPALDRALAMKPDYFEAYEALAQHYMQNGQMSLAIEQCDRLLAIDPNRLTALSNRGYAKLLSGKPEAALADVEEAIRLNPGFAQAYRVRAAIYRQTGRLQEAAADLERAGQLSGK